MSILTARAKANLFLRVLGKRPDGFHEIESVFHTLDLADRVRLEPDDVISCRMTYEGLAPLDIDPTDNIAFRAAVELKEASGYPSGVRIDIGKAIPHGAGLGGGSCDAAAVLLGANEMWELGWPVEQLQDVAERLGSDVPYCLRGGSALVTGRGEFVGPLPAPLGLWVVLGVSYDPLSTAEVYGRWRPSERAHTSHQLAMALGAGDVHGVAEALHNDLEEPAFALRPDLVAAKEAMLGAGALGSVMSGSGPTILGLAEDEEHALEVAKRLTGAFDRIEVTSTRSRSVTIDAG